MEVRTITEAKAHLSSLLQRVVEGEEVILGRAGKPIAKIIPYTQDREPRVPGKLKGQIHIHEDFDELPAEFSSEFGIEEKSS